MPPHLPKNVKGLVLGIIATAKRRPLLFIGGWILKTLVVLLVLNMHHGDGNPTPIHQGSKIDTTRTATLVKQGGPSGGSVVPSEGMTTQGVSLRSGLVDGAAGESEARRGGGDMALAASIVTSLGSIEIEFLPDAAPKTVQNFVGLARRGFFNKTTLYRYERNFVLQGGGWPKKTSPLPAVPLEYSAPNVKYAISTARTADPNSATCEYSIMLNDNAKWLGPGGSDPYGYAVFAKVVGGFDVIDRFSSLRTRQQGLTLLDPPIEVITWALHS